MKKLTLLLILTLLTIIVKGQVKHKHIAHPDTIKRYWMADITFKVDSGCTQSKINTFFTIAKVPTFDDVKSNFVKWVYPNKIIDFEITSLKEIQENEQFTKSDTFKCVPYKPVIYDTTKRGIWKYNSSDTLGFVHGTNTFTSYADTTKVLALCIINKRGKTKWKSMFAISPYSLYIEAGFIIGAQYLMPDRKTKSIYKVIYSTILNK